MIALPKESPEPYQQVDKALNPGSKIISMITSSDLRLNAFLVLHNPHNSPPGQLVLLLT